jgi:hypothetical protein
MSRKKRLLVEGKDDKQFFKLLLEELYTYEKSEIVKGRVSIDSAEILIDFEQTIGNREKVEVICHSVKDTSYANNLVGFVDREFREFELGANIQDKLTVHKVQDRLVWSRGHSVENYFFDFSILRDPLRDLSATEFFDEALTLFERVIESTIRLACAASLTGNELGKLNLIKHSISWKLLEVTPSGVVLLLDGWEKYLVEKQGLPLEEAQKIINRHQGWYKRIEIVDFCLVRWMCHGHIGLAFIWAVYSRCVYNVCPGDGRRKPETEVANVQGIKEGNRFHACASWWARKAMGNQCDYPIEVFKLLDLVLPKQNTI